ncbi:DUF2786 domain-containing protein [Kitasatospora sp. NPDC059973]|uniref:DUF2786 domain-containing protein n=1 Tax=Kitasatospora sp. NPDC059973 TaxID=3347020 RepID=UPI00367D244D
MIPWLLTVIGNLVAILGAGSALRGFMRREYNRVVAGGIIALLGLAVTAGWTGTAFQWVWDNVAGGTGAPTTEAPKPETGSGSGFPVEALWWLLGSIGAVAAVSGVVAFVTGRRRNAAERRDSEVRSRARWEAIVAEHDEVREAYGAFVLDVLAVLDRPALADVNMPQTVAFLHAMDYAGDVARGADPILYREAVSNLKTAWAAADGHARKTGLRHLPERERTTVSRARALLVKALSDSGSEHERQAAYAKARELLADVVTLPQQTAAALTSRRWLSLTKGEPTTR